MTNPVTLKQIRAKLRRRLTPRDKVGFCYESVFGCERSAAFYTPHILVRVELRNSNENSDMFKFKVFTDFHLPVGADVESAIHFSNSTKKAVLKARWARRIVDGLEWDRKEILP